MHTQPIRPRRGARLMTAFFVVLTLVAGLLASPASAAPKVEPTDTGSTSYDTTVEAKKSKKTRTSKQGRRAKTDAAEPVPSAEPAPTPTPVPTPVPTAEPAVAPIEVEAAMAADMTVEAVAIAEAVPTAGLELTDYDAVSNLGSMYNVVDQIGARALWEKGITGEGVHVAVIDTGVAPVPALLGDDKVVAMVDLSLESHVPEAVYLDTFGHGSHMSGIIAGRTPGADPATAADNPDQFLGVAPGAGIVSVKVGDNSGAVDVSQVIAAIDWVVQHHDSDGLNIRVINLSYGTDSTQDYRIDPLAAAVENAWDHGIVVVVAAGNDGWGSHTGLSNPAHDPYVIAVGAAEATEHGFAIPAWTSGGEFATKSSETEAESYLWSREYALFWEDDYEGRIPDVIAPGAHIDSLRVPGSRIDAEHPEGYVSPQIFRGSGSSQAAAVVSGAAALLLDARPDLTPDQVKALFKSTADQIFTLPTLQGSGVINVAAAAAAPTPDAIQTWDRSTGLGSLEAARGTQHVTVDGAIVEGETTVWGEQWDPATWRKLSTLGVSWSGASWSGASWSGASWSGASWSGASWSGASWSGASWSGVRWG